MWWNINNMPADLDSGNSINQIETDTLVKNNDLDYLDMLFRQKFRYGTKDEIVIKLK